MANTVCISKVAINEEIKCYIPFLRYLRTKLIFKLNIKPSSVIYEHQ